MSHKDVYAPCMAFWVYLQLFPLGVPGAELRPGVGHRHVLGAGRLSAALALERGPGSPGNDALRAARRGTDAPGTMKKSGDSWGEPLRVTSVYIYDIYIYMIYNIYIKIYNIE